MSFPIGKSKRWRLWLPASLLIVLLEIGIRSFGLLSLPLYEANSRIGYIPRPNQSGAFLNRNDWRFNEYSMGTGSFEPEPGRFNVLLVGDSIVLGGNPFRQQERLGPQLEASTGWQVWPISAGSWALLNELNWLDDHRDSVVRRIDAVVLVLNSGDFGSPSSWQCELTHPRTPPLWGALYVFRRYVNPVIPCGGVDPSLKVPEGDWSERLKKFQAAAGKPLTIVLYPDRAELNDPQRYEAAFAGPKMQLAAISKEYSLRIAELIGSKGWNGSLYRDGIHPTAAGDSALAEFVAGLNLHD